WERVALLVHICRFAVRPRADPFDKRVQGTRAVRARSSPSWRLASTRPFSPLFCRTYFNFFFFQAEDGIRDKLVTGVQTCALPILNPASHFSLNLHEPMKKLLDRYDAKKVFIEGDAIILAIFETESSIAYARPVAKACILSRQILAVCNSYNEQASSSDFPALELGLGVAFQGDAPTYWVDGDSRIMISKALNLSDRLSGCAKLAKRMLAKQKSHFSVFQFLN